MSYFNRLPDVYVAEGRSTGENFKYRLAKNLFRRVYSRDDLDKYTTFFEQYEIEDGDTPSSLALLVSGDVFNDWIILMVNNITDVYEQWPKRDNELYAYIEEKYDSVDGLHHWETNEILYNDIVFIKEGIEVNETFRAVLPDGTTKTKNESIYPVTNYEYEQYLNEQKRQILLPNPQIVDIMIEEFEDLVTYQPSKELDDNDSTKKTELSIAQLFLDRKGSVYASATVSSELGVVTSFDYGSTVGNATATAGVVQTNTVTVSDTTSTTTSSSSSSSGSSGGSGY